MAQDTLNRPERGTLPIGKKPDPEVKHEGPAPQRASWTISNEEFLLKHGWTKVGDNEMGFSTWKDPVGTDRPVETINEIKLPTKEGGYEIVKQKGCGPASWTYNMAMAMTIQHQRLKAIEDAPRLAAEKAERLRKVEELRELERLRKQKPAVKV